MQQRTKGFVHTQTSKVIFALSIAVSLFILAGKTIDVYEFDIVGAIFELLWLPMIVGLIALPIISLFFLIRQGFHFRSFYFYSILLIGLAILVLWLVKK